VTTLAKQVLALGCVILLAGWALSVLSGCGSSETGDRTNVRPVDPSVAANIEEAKRKAAVEKALAEVEKSKKKGGCGADGGCCCAAAGKACICSGDKPTTATERPAAFWSANAVVLTAAPQGHGPWLASSTYLVGAPNAK
jgi:hypothetical protein